MDETPVSFKGIVVGANWEWPDLLLPDVSPEKQEISFDTGNESPGIEKRSTDIEVGHFIPVY